MRRERGRRSRNLEDRRARRAARGPGRVRVPLPRGRGGRLSLTGIVILLGICFLLGRGLESGDPAACDAL